MAEVKTVDPKLSVFENRRLGSSAMLTSLGIHRIAHLMPRARHVAEKRRMIVSTVNSLDLRRPNDKQTPMLSTSSTQRVLLFRT